MSINVTQLYERIEKQLHRKPYKGRTGKNTQCEWAGCHKKLKVGRDVIEVMLGKTTCTRCALREVLKRIGEITGLIDQRDSHQVKWEIK